MKKTLFSGIQPSGKLTLGNYMGAFKQWLKLQDSYNCIFSIVDLHAITVKQDPKLLSSNSLDSLAVLLALGLDPKKSTIFIQSSVSEHTELAWLLNCNTFMGELNRMTQYKDKSIQHKDNINLGLFAYPTLQAADILLYQTELVPVGADQKQHIELCRDIAIRFNKNYQEIFKIPEPYIPEKGARIMSLSDPSKKMSKSDPSQLSYIGILDEPDLIIKKFKKSVTDSDGIIKYDENNKPGVSNLLNLLHLASDKSIEVLENELASEGYGKLKQSTADAIISILAPIQQKYGTIRDDESYLREVIEMGRDKACAIAAKTVNSAKQAMGLFS